MIKIVIGLFLINFQHKSCIAQLSTTESLKNVTECDFRTNVNVTCGTDERIAIHSLQYAYHVRCETTCCDTYTSTDCFENADTADIQNIRRICSGQTSCQVSSLSDNIDFVSCALSVQSVSYVFLQYYCIPNSRTSSICASGETLTSAGSPLYITNENYPGVTTGSESCSCSLEAYSCSTDINLYIIDADLYLDTSTCEQNVVFKDGTDGTLKTIGCESYYTNSITSSSINSHYVRIDFVNNSTANQEGYFFIGLEAADADTSFSLSCTAQTEAWCVDCGTLPGISFGTITLDDSSNTGHQAEATVNCNSGYETNSSKITCLANATWETPVCSPKDCGSVPDVQYGDVTLDEADSSNYGASASVTCNLGYETNDETITCMATGAWENTTCTPKDCGTVPSISNGQITLKDSSNSSYGASADVMCNSGYNTSKPEITCLSTGSWENVQLCEDISTENGNDEDGQDSKEKDGGLAAWIIPVVVVVPVICIIGVVVYIICKKTTAVKPENEVMEVPVQDRIRRISEACIKTERGTREPELPIKTPLPAIPKKHEIKHGHIYIDHGDAHIFGITIHLPFAGKSANRLEPLKKRKDANQNEGKAHESD